MGRIFSCFAFCAILFTALTGTAQTVNTLRSTEDSALVNFMITDIDSVPVEDARLVVTSTDKLISKESVSDAYGHCYMLLPEGKTYNMTVYKFHTDFPSDKLLNLPVEKGRYSHDQTIRVKIIRDYSRIFNLDNVYFDVNKWDIKAECVPHVENLYNTLVLNPKMVIEIAGHTDSDGDAHQNLVLSQNRADAVMNYLIKLGLDPKRVRAKGYGEYKPLVPNDNAPNKARNRRTEVRVLDE